MNKVILMGRLTRDPEIRWTQGQDQMCIARFTLAVDRRQRRQDGQQAADFPSCTAFGKSAEFCEKYLKKGTKVASQDAFRRDPTRTATGRRYTRQT